MAWAQLEGVEELRAGALGAAESSFKPISSCPQSAVLVPVPEAEPVVGQWRAVHDPKALTGVPAHITLLYPWVSPEQLKPAHLEELDELLSEQAPFGYVLDKVSWFGERVLWLAPNPAEPFKRLTARLAARFGTQPWQGEFPDVVPHLTVGLSGHALSSSLEEAGAAIAEKLPLHCEAREVVVMCGDGLNWEVVHRTVLRLPAAG
ncbi:MAG TPA: 2'-5' RNA ligase family protein [Acidimicrobiales bacterium]|nr:2'-5' RNA ligase family protein [Acidimicrobiales bacterium]